MAATAEDATADWELLLVSGVGFPAEKPWSWCYPFFPPVIVISCCGTSYQKLYLSEPTLCYEVIKSNCFLKKERKYITIKLLQKYVPLKENFKGENHSKTQHSNTTSVFIFKLLNACYLLIYSCALHSLSCYSILNILQLSFMS